MIDDLARALYDSCPTIKPDWDQLGEVTKSVWRERVQPFRFSFGFYPSEQENPDVISSAFFQPAHQEEPMSNDPNNINIVQIEAASGIPLTAAFVRDTLGIAPVSQEKRAMFWNINQWPQIVGALAQHIGKLNNIDPRTFSGQRPKKDKPGEPAAGAVDTPPAAAAGGFNFGAAPAPTPAPLAGGFNFGAAPAPTPAPTPAPAAASGFTF